MPSRHAIASKSVVGREGREMGGKYQLFIQTEAPVMALDDDGGCDIADFALSHGYSEAVNLFTDWMLDRIHVQAVQRETEKRRRQIKIVPVKRKLGGI